MGQAENEGFTLKDRLNSGQEYYEIRLESIGGLGANLCGKMLGELGIKYLDVNSSSFSSYGSEKTGTPVKGYIRYCKKEKEIRVHSPVTKPDLLVVFHQALLKDSTVLSGCGPNTTVIVALESEDSVAKVVNLINSGKCYGLEAQKIAIETKSRINVVMLGAILRLMGLDSIEAGEKICTEVLGKKYPEALKGNLEGMARGYEEVRRLEGVGKAGLISKDGLAGASLEGKEDGVEGAGKERLMAEDGYCENRGQSRHMPENNKWGYKTAPIGGINPRLGSTVIADLSPSRQGYIPIFIEERCINCGQCHLTCPDMVFQFAKGIYKGKEMMVNQGLDYYHCKGCLRCVDICPVNALVRGEEAKHTKKENFVPNRELIRMPKYYEDAGADGYITSESYLTEKRMDGGEV